MRLALMEMEIIWEDKQANYEKLVGVLDRLKHLNKLPQFIALPEMSFTGFSMNTQLTAEGDNDSYPTIEFVKKLAMEYEIAIAFGWVKKLNKAENHYMIVNADGEIILDYAKIHPFSFSEEDKYFQGGDSVYTCRNNGFNIGAAICYDLRFPEVFQAVADDVELILLPANWPSKRREHFITLSYARAIENQCYFATINCRGDIGGLHYSGDSMLVAPAGERVAPLEEIEIDNSKIFIYDIDNNVADVREKFPTRKDRKNELYARILKNDNQ